MVYIIQYTNAPNADVDAAEITRATSAKAGLR